MKLSNEKIVSIVSWKKKIRMKSSARVTILLATFNRSDLVIGTLNSILHQTYRNWNCIIVDDRSLDGTPNVIRKFIEGRPQFQFYEKPAHVSQGLSASRNYALELAREFDPEYIQFFDDDDLMHPQKLELQVKSLEKNPAAEFCICGTKNFTRPQEINESDKIESIDPGKLNLGEAYLTGKISFVAQVPLFRSRFALEFKFDEDLFYAEEWTLFSMLFFLKKPEFTSLQEVLFFRRKHPISITEREDSDFSKRKTRSVTGIKIFNFLDENDLHTKVSLLYFLRQFLLYNYESEVLVRIRSLMQQNYPGLIYRYSLALSIHWFLRKVILQILNYNKV